jgi:hypothetical protein
MAALLQLAGHGVDHIGQQGRPTALPVGTGAILPRPRQAAVVGAPGAGEVPVHRHLAGDDDPIV